MKFLLRERHDWLPYVAPMAAFLLLTSVEASVTTKEGLPDPALYPWFYAAKVVVVAFVAWVFRSAWRDLKPFPGPLVLAVSVLVGLGVILVWVAIDPYTPTLPLLGQRSAFDPGVLPQAIRAAFLAVRFAGLVVLVPLIEELFWRSFLIRWLIDPEFTKVPIGRVTPMAAVVSAALFASVHPEWIAALITGLAWAWLLWWSRSVAACVVSHAAANLALGIYVVATGTWKFL